jgi:hypothetical protein
MQNWLTILGEKLGMLRARPTAARSDLDALLSEVLGGGVVRTSGLDEHGRFVAVIEVSSPEQIGEQTAGSPANVRAANAEGPPRAQIERKVQR